MEEFERDIPAEEYEDFEWIIRESYD